LASEALTKYATRSFTRGVVAGKRPRLQQLPMHRCLTRLEPVGGPGHSIALCGPGDADVGLGELFGQPAQRRVLDGGPGRTDA
jgi:hypothetical protein